jgi:hypothetical protein
MRGIIIILVVFAVFYAGYLGLDYLGYYVEWKNPIIGAVIATPLVQAAIQLFKRPENTLFKRRLKNQQVIKDKNANEVNG